MFQLISLAIHGDSCALNGVCASPKSTQIGGEDNSSLSTKGVYTAEQVYMYRTCSADFKSKFKIAWDSPLPFYGKMGYTPVDGTSQIEAFRGCWGPVTSHNS